MNMNEHICRKCLLSVGRDCCIVLARILAGFNSNITLETHTSADRLTVEKTERWKEESKRILSDAYNEILLNIASPYPTGIHVYLTQTDV